MRFINRPTLSNTWKRLGHSHLGRIIFSKMIGWYAPYTGSISAYVQMIDQQECKVLLKEKRSIRNHLNCIHAIALMNLGEIVTGLKVMHSIDGIGRGIVTCLQMHYYKKSRGEITAICEADIPTTTGIHQVVVMGKLYNSQKDLVAEIKASWQIEIRDSRSK